MSDMEDTVLYEQFAQARTRAIEITDHFNTTAADDPRRAELWEHVMRQTEAARLLLERWLRSGRLSEQLGSANLGPSFTPDRTPRRMWMTDVHDRQGLRHDHG